MPLSLYIALGAGTALLLLTLLFRVEEHKGGRLFLRSARSWADRQTLWLAQSGSFLLVHYVLGTIRIGFHAALHGVIVLSRFSLQRLERWLHYWQHRNRSVVRNIQSSARENHLSSIAEHKVATSLTDAEKRKLKEKHLEG